MNRLQLKNMNRHPSMPYKINEVYESARFILQSSVNMGSLTLPKAKVIPTQVVTDSGIKLEDLNLLFKNFGKTLIEALSVVGANKPNPVNRTSEAPTARNATCAEDRTSSENAQSLMNTLKPGKLGGIMKGK